MSRISRLHRCTRSVVLRLLALMLAISMLPIVVSAEGNPGGLHQDGGHAWLPMIMKGHVPSTPPTSEELIDQAVEDGTIDEETGLVYKVYASFGDERLPTQFHGASSPQPDSHIIDETQARWGTLSPETQATLAPFLMPPIYRGSWFDLRTSSAGQSIGAASLAPVCSEADTAQWNYKDAETANVRIWWQKSRPGDSAAANNLVAAMDDHIWPTLTGLMGVPPSDAAVPCGAGDGRVDIYLVPGIRSCAPSHTPPGCKKTPAYVLLNPTDTAPVLAHEFMHVLQWGKDVKDGCAYPGEYAWLMEATAQWAADRVYADAQWEQYTAPWFFSGTDIRSLEYRDDSHEYGAYLYFLYLTHGPENDQLVPTVWQNVASSDSLEAVNQAIAGGFEQVWGEFARINWNVPPEDRYKQWDSLVVQAKSHDGAVTVTGAGEWSLPEKVPHLTTIYKHFKFSGELPRLVSFYNGLSYKLTERPLQPWDNVPYLPDDSSSKLFEFEEVPSEETKGLTIQALYLVEGEDQWQVEDWTNEPYATFCRDLRDERLKELVIILSNSEYDPRTYEIEAQGLAPQVRTSNIGCYQYKGTADYTFDYVDGYGYTEEHEEQHVRNLVLERVDGYSRPSIIYPTMEFMSVEGQWTWSYQGQIDDCSLEGNDSLTFGNGEDGGWFAIAHGITSGPAERSYFGDLQVDRYPTIVYTCPDYTDTSYASPAPYLSPDTVMYDESPRYVTIAADGTIQEHYVWSGDGQQLTYDWTLTPQREP